MTKKILSIYILIGFIFIGNVISENSIPSTAKSEEELSGKLIEYIKVVGNDSIRQSLILQKINSKLGNEYDKEVIQKDKDRIAELYRQYGYFKTKSTVKVDKIDSVVKVTLFIDEGVRYKVKQIVLKGNNAIEDKVIRNKLKTKVGKNFVPKKLDNDIKELKEFYQKRSYPTVEVKSNVEYISSEKKVNVKLDIQEGPKVIINFYGNQHIESKEFRRDFPLLERGNLSRFTLKKSVALIEEKYKKRGYFLVKVRYDAIEEKKPVHKVVFNFFIDEGQLIYIAEIEFEGNESISDEELREHMATKPRSIFAGIPLLGRWFPKGIYNENVLANDIHSLRLFYKRNGYSKVEIQSLDEIEPEIRNNRIYISISIDEGQQLYIKEEPEIIYGKILSEDEIENLETKKGEPYNPDILLSDEIYLRSKYAEKGYIYAQVKSTFSDGIVKFYIDRGKRAYLDEIRFFGNRKTKEDVLRREFLVKEGEPFNTVKISKSQQRLYSLGLFSNVNFETQGMNLKREKIDLFVRLAERNMNSFNFSGGYEPSEGYFASIESYHRNLLGRGRKLRTKLSQGRKGSLYELSFMSPWFLNTRTRSRTRIFRENLEEQEGMLSTGGSFSLARDFGLSSVRLEYQYKIIDQRRFLELFSSDDDFYSTVSSIELSFRRDTRDFFLSPTKGWFHSVNLKYAGGPLLRGDNNFLKFDSDSRHYRSVSNWVFAFALRTGYERGLRATEDIISLERFFAGGSSTIRGYKERSLGEKDEFGLHRGDIKLIFNTELRTPFQEIPLPKEGFWSYLPRDLGGAVFLDIGNVWNTFEQVKRGQLAYSVGLGIRVKTPLGPIRLDYAQPLEEELSNKWSSGYYLGIGQMF